MTQERDKSLKRKLEKGPESDSKEAKVESDLPAYLQNHLGKIQEIMDKVYEQEKQNMLQEMKSLGEELCDQKKQKVLLEKSKTLLSDLIQKKEQELEKLAGDKRQELESELALLRTQGELLTERLKSNESIEKYDDSKLEHFIKKQGIIFPSEQQFLSLMRLVGTNGRWDDVVQNRRKKMFEKAPFIDVASRVMAGLYKQYGDPEAQNFTEADIEAIQIVLLFWSASESTRLSASGEACKNYLSQIGMTEEEAQQYSEILYEYKENTAWKIVQDVIALSIVGKNQNFFLAGLQFYWHFYQKENFGEFGKKDERKLVDIIRDLYDIFPNSPNSIEKVDDKEASRTFKILKIDAIEKDEKGNIVGISHKNIVRMWRKKVQEDQEQDKSYQHQVKSSCLNRFYNPTEAELVGAELFDGDSQPSRVKPSVPTVLEKSSTFPVVLPSKTV